jgi:hypothetical protein
MSYTREPYEESEEVKAARDALDIHNASKPAYVSSWGGQLNDTLDKILNRKDFNYDINGDALYQQYKDKYIQQGKMAMQDTVGQASAMTGGYGNSWAATAGNQAYQAHLNNLNDVVPELYALAYDKYNQEGNDLRQQYALLADKEATDYGRYKDQLLAWDTDRTHLQDALDDASKRDYDQYLTDEERDYKTYLAGLEDSTTDNALTNDNLSYWTELFYNTAKNGTFGDIAKLMTKAEESGLSPTIVDNIYDNALDMVYYPEKYQNTPAVDAETWAGILKDAGGFALSGETALATYLNGLVDKKQISEDDALSILNMYFPQDKT